MDFEIIHGDALEVMRSMEANSVDAVVTDPPFVVPTQHYASRSVDNKFGRKWSDISPLIGWFDIVAGEVARVLRPSGHFVCFCNADSYPAFYPAVFSRFGHADCLVWDKGKIGMGRGWRKRTEFIVVGRNQDAWFSQVTKSTVLSCPVVPSDQRVHPAQKPVALLREIIGHVTPPGGLVIDPFSGSASTGEAAFLEGRSFIGIEREVEYVAIAEARILEAKRQLGLFA